LRLTHVLLLVNGSATSTPDRPGLLLVIAAQIRAAVRGTLPRTLPPHFTEQTQMLARLS